MSVCWETGLCIRLNLLTNKCAIGHCKSKLKLGSLRAFTRPLNYTEQPRDTSKSPLSSLSPAGWAVGCTACRLSSSVKLVAKLELVKKLDRFTTAAVRNVETPFIEFKFSTLCSFASILVLLRRLKETFEPAPHNL